DPVADGDGALAARTPAGEARGEHGGDLRDVQDLHLLAAGPPGAVGARVRRHPIEVAVGSHHFPSFGSGGGSILCSLASSARIAFTESSSEPLALSGTLPLPISLDSDYSAGDAGGVQVRQRAAHGERVVAVGDLDLHVRRRPPLV